MEVLTYKSCMQGLCKGTHPPKQNSLIWLSNCIFWYLRLLVIDDSSWSSNHLRCIHCRHGKAPLHSHCTLPKAKALGFLLYIWEDSALDATFFEEVWPLAHLFYVLTRMKPTMLRSPRIAQTGQSALHGAKIACIGVCKRSNSGRVYPGAPKTMK